MYKKSELLTIKEWCLRFGIKVINPNGFKGRKNQIWNKKYTKRQFERGIKRSYITVNTDKGLEFLENINKVFIRTM